MGYIPPQTDEELQAFDELHKDYVPRIKDRHVDVDKIINGETKCLDIDNDDVIKREIECIKRGEYDDD